MRLFSATTVYASTVACCVLASLFVVAFPPAFAQEPEAVFEAESISEVAENASAEVSPVEAPVDSEPETQTYISIPGKEEQEAACATHRDKLNRLNRLPGPVAILVGPYRALVQSRYNKCLLPQKEQNQAYLESIPLSTQKKGNSAAPQAGSKPTVVLTEPSAE